MGHTHTYTYTFCIYCNSSSIFHSAVLFLDDLNATIPISFSLLVFISLVLLHTHTRTNTDTDVLHSILYLTLPTNNNVKTGVSSSIDNEDYFELMIRNAWRMAGGEVKC